VEDQPQTLILGAGITGLCIAHSLQESGEDCQVIETSKTVGGALQTVRKDGFLAEYGPNSLLLKDKRVAQLFSQIGLTDTDIQDARPEAHNRFIVDQGKLHSVPTSPLRMLRSPLFSFGGILRIAKEPFISRHHDHKDESFADFVRRRLGNEVLTNAAEPFVNGIYAGNPEHLSIRHAFPRISELENNHRSLILSALAKKKGKYSNPHTLSPTRTISFKEGLAALPQTIAKNLTPKTVHLDCKVNHITANDNGWQLTWIDSDGIEHTTQYRRLVIAIPHHRLAELPLPTNILQQLVPVFNITAPPVTSLVLGFRRDQVKHPLDGFGMLIKTADAPDEHVTLTCMMGGAKNPQYAENTDDVVMAELQRLLGVRGAPCYRHRTHWRNAIPQYNIGYQSVLDALQNCEKSNIGLHFSGNYRGGISVTDCIINGLQLGKQLTDPGR